MLLWNMIIEHESNNADEIHVPSEKSRMSRYFLRLGGLERHRGYSSSGPVLKGWEPTVTGGVVVMGKGRGER